MFSKLPGVLAALAIVGSLVFAVVAQMTDPPLEPADTLMYWQALWDDGRYGVNYTFAVTWFCVLCALFGPPSLVAMSVDALRAARGRPTMPKWPRLAWKRMDEPTRVRLGLVLTALGLLFGAVCLVDPEVFTPVGFLARIALIFWPFTLWAGPALLLDVALPATVTAGPVTELERTPGPSPQHPGTCQVAVGEQRFELPPALWAQLRVGDTVAVRRSGGFGRVLELARE